MNSPTVPVNRTLVGLLALLCLAAAVVLALQSSGDELWQSAFLRVGLLLGAFWLALPTTNRRSAWADISPKTLLAAVLGLLVIARLRIPLRVILPVFAMLAVAILILRPRKRQWK